MGAAVPDTRAALEEWADRHLRSPSIGAGAASLGDAHAYREQYLRPLLALLELWLETGEQHVADVYVDERRRFVPGGDGRAEALGEVRALVLADQAALLEAVPAEQRPALADRLSELHRPLVDAPAGDAMEALLVGDCLMTELRAALTPELERRGIHLSSAHVYFSTSMGVELSTSEVKRQLEHTGADVLGLSFLTFEGLPPYVALLADARRLRGAELQRRVDELVGLIRRFVDDVRASSDVPILLHGVCGLPLDRYRKRLPLVPPLSRSRRRVLDALNAALRAYAAAVENTVFLDEAALVEAAGVRAVARPLFDAGLTHDAAFHTSGLGRALAQEYADVVQARHDLRGTKALLVDFDNTLWSGVMAEGPVVHDVEAQRLLASLREAGILLVAVSKNDEGAIRWDELALDPSDFVLHKIGWNHKPQSIQEAASQLDLSLRSFVFLDDNPVERRLVSEALPEVRTLDSLDPLTWKRLRHLLAFPETRRTAEAARRTELYREAAARREALSGPTDYGRLLGDLGLEVAVVPVRPEHVDRVGELVARTTQFNTTSRRRTQAELLALLDDDDCSLLSFALKDRFGDLGVVGVTIAERAPDGLRLDSVIMSCRAMGFGLETLMVAEAIARGPRGADVVGEFVPTDRNGPSASLFADCGFERVDDAGTRWRLPGGAAAPQPPAWLAVRRPS